MDSWMQMQFLYHHSHTKKGFEVSKVKVVLEKDKHKMIPLRNSSLKMLGESLRKN